ncbi:TerB family tellurite resistance protein [Fulvimarina sp. 2208YS6-2-32]|uniref:TerB family tellurite resistance protein n=1 Tax=Fulvimarina uroteuthidis TaxID=3098149 RepID=A0ABU5HZ58_9HYPH|nr:TerB family tellurite resistance protein [Fulvimarina sp. 2208YS6-2-32]MDY8108409.1 TerB family tellurite resistance protein [Fulvimarina sp. 2208YS6-2-32]
MARSLFSGFRDLLNQISPDAAPREAGGQDELVVAIAALLFHVVSADGIVTEEERESLDAVLREDYGLSHEQALEVAAAGERANEEAVDLYRFTSVLKNRLEAEERADVVRHLWEVTFADGAVHELEDNVVWRVSELLGVSSRDRMIMKKEFADRARP